MPPLCKGRWRKAPEGLYPFGRAAQRRPYINGCHICHPYDFHNPPSLLPNGKGGLLSRALKQAAQRDVLSAKLHQTAKQAAKNQRSPEPLHHLSATTSLAQEGTRGTTSSVLLRFAGKPPSPEPLSASRFAGEGFGNPFPDNPSVCFADTSPYTGEAREERDRGDKQQYKEEWNGETSS